MDAATLYGLQGGHYFRMLTCGRRPARAGLLDFSTQSGINPLLLILGQSKWRAISWFLLIFLDLYLLYGPGEPRFSGKSKTVVYGGGRDPGEVVVPGIPGSGGGARYARPRPPSCARPLYRRPGYTVALPEVTTPAVPSGPTPRFPWSSY